MVLRGLLISLRGFGGREAGRAVIFEGGFPQGVWGREGSMWPFLGGVRSLAVLTYCVVWLDVGFVQVNEVFGVDWGNY